jgi:formate dehydrogenase maturation protein FdhE
MLAEQLQPVVDVHRAIHEHGYGSTDVERAQQRIRSGRTGFDAWALIEETGDLSMAFAQMATAFERAGLASASSISAMDGGRVDPMASTLSWTNAESAPVDSALRLARRVAAVVGNAVLSRVARDVMHDLLPLAWRRPLCPCCGAGPDLAFQTEARRYLVCWRCDTTWRTDDRGCLGCGETSAPALVRIPSPYLGYELAICNACGRYLKERRGGLTHAAIVERTLTAALDDAAQLRGLRS